MTEPSARILADSISPDGVRLTTMEVVMHRFVLAEYNTHRVKSRNSASSRAIPFSKQVDRVTNDIAFPVVWAAEQPGMQGGDEIEDVERAKALWAGARDDAVGWAQDLANLGVHKSICNRLLEPFMWHTVICTATEWDGFWRQRCSPLAQPEMKAAAEAMYAAYHNPEAPPPEPLDYGMWHMPLLDADTIMEVTNEQPDAMELLKKISVARCARVSYLTHDGKRDWVKDLDLYEKLVSAEPAHASPLEHVATPCVYESGIVKQHADGTPHLGNFRGWDQLRHRVLDF